MTDIKSPPPNVFKILDDGLIYVKAGGQMNCAGLAIIKLKIFPLETAEILFEDYKWKGLHDEGYGADVPAADIPTVFRQAIFDGANLAFAESKNIGGLKFRLFSATVHLIDANERMFRVAGYIAVKKWLALEKE
jgi:hypothetical protein